MGTVREAFKQAVDVGSWNDAFLNLNGLSMADMLRALAELPPARMNQVMEKSMSCWSGVNMPRIAFAATVVKQRTIPAQIPTDVASTGQVQDAKRFLAAGRRTHSHRKR